MSLYSEIESDAAKVMAESGDVIELRGRSIPALISEPEILTEPVAGGLNEAGQLSVKLLRSSLADGLPRYGERIRYADTTYRIVRVADRPSRPLIALTLEPADG